MTDPAEFTTPTQAAAQQRAWEDELIRRFDNGLSLTRTDYREARRLKAQRAQPHTQGT